MKLRLPVSSNKESILINPGGPSIIIRVLKWGRRRQRDGSVKDSTLVALEHGWGQQTDNAGKLKRLEKVKNSPQDLP